MDDDDCLDLFSENPGDEQTEALLRAIEEFGLEPFLTAPSALHETLSSPLRKQLLLELYRAEDPLTVSQLAERLCERANTPYEDRSRVVIRIEHVHLPKLRASGLAGNYNSSDKISINPKALND